MDLMLISPRRSPFIDWLRINLLHGCCTASFSSRPRLSENKDFVGREVHDVGSLGFHAVFCDSIYILKLSLNPRGSLLYGSALCAPFHTDVIVNLMHKITKTFFHLAVACLKIVNMFFLHRIVGLWIFLTNTTLHSVGVCVLLCNRWTFCSVYKSAYE